MEYIQWLIANYTEVLTPVAYVALALAVVLRFVAPLTNTTVDDRAVGYIDRVYRLLLRALAGKAALPPLPEDK